MTTPLFLIFSDKSLHITQCPLKNLHNSNNVSQYLIKHKTHLNCIVQIQQYFPFFSFSSYLDVIHGNTVNLFLS